tara:strand:- start:32 stop:424 length:393 start_codon:yes stop_codon:yes gene_type:complete
MNISQGNFNISNIPANAMDKSSENSRFDDEFRKNIDELSEDIQINQIEHVDKELKEKINTIKDDIQQLNKHKRNDHGLNILNNKILHLIELLKENPMNSVRSSLKEIFENVETKQFKQQINMIKQYLNKT